MASGRPALGLRLPLETHVGARRPREWLDQPAVPYELRKAAQRRKEAFNFKGRLRRDTPVWQSRALVCGNLKAASGLTLIYYDRRVPMM